MLCDQNDISLKNTYKFKVRHIVTKLQNLQFNPLFLQLKLDYLYKMHTLRG